MSSPPEAGKTYPYMATNDELTLNLEDIIPRAAIFTLRLTGITYAMRPVSLSDELWLKNTFGSGLQKILEEMEMRPICRIVFHLLDEKSKEHFAKQTVTIMNEEGDKVSETKGGAELLYCLISGFDEKMKVFQALLETIGLSRPIQEKFVEAEKKKLQDLAKSIPTPSATEPTGPGSSTPSLTSTDGPPSTSPAEPGANSTGGSKP